MGRRNRKTEEAQTIAAEGPEVKQPADMSDRELLLHLAEQVAKLFNMQRGLMKRYRDLETLITAKEVGNDETSKVCDAAGESDAAG